MPARVRELRALLLQHHGRRRTSRIWGPAASYATAQKGGNDETPGRARAPLSSMAPRKIALQDCWHEGSAHASIRLQKVGAINPS